MAKTEVTAGKPPPHRATEGRVLAPAVWGAAANPVPRIVDSLDERPLRHARKRTAGRGGHSGTLGKSIEAFVH
jgi:hypothetical protein